MSYRVFISYRSSDGADKATALARDLDAMFGDDQIFLDKEDLAPGSRWRDGIAAALGNAPVLLVLVTPNLGAARCAGPALHRPCRRSGARRARGRHRRRGPHHPAALRRRGGDAFCLRTAEPLRPPMRAPMGAAARLRLARRHGPPGRRSGRARPYAASGFDARHHSRAHERADDDAHASRRARHGQRPIATRSPTRAGAAFSGSPPSPFSRSAAGVSGAGVKSARPCFPAPGASASARAARRPRAKVN